MNCLLLALIRDKNAATPSRNLPGNAVRLAANVAATVDGCAAPDAGKRLDRYVLAKAYGLPPHAVVLLHPNQSPDQLPVQSPDHHRNKKNAEKRHALEERRVATRRVAFVLHPVKAATAVHDGAQKSRFRVPVTRFHQP